jgi:signal transduction histidine kinase
MSTERAAGGGGDGEALVPESEVRSQLEHERAAVLYSKGLLPYLSNLVIGGIMVAAIGDDVSGARRFSWLLTMVALTLLRIGVWLLHRMRPARLTPHRWLIAFTIGATLNGLLWGAITEWLWSPSQVHRALLAFVIGGMVAGSTAVVPAFMPAYYTFALPCLIPLVLRLSFSGRSMDMTMGAMLGFFGVAMTQLARGAGRWFRETTELRLHNARLVEHLSEARAKLEQRVQERTAELERTIAQVRAAEAEAREAVRARSEFLAVASHELRTPLATMELQLARLESGRDQPAGATPPRSRLDVSVLRRQVRRLTRLVDTVMTASGLLQDSLVLEPQEVDLTQLVQEVIDDLATHRGPASGPIELTAPGPVLGRWDPTRVEQIVANLLGNALKYGGPAPVRVSVEADDQQVSIRVQDSGPGVERELRERIFERFFRADTGAATGGLGLGLAVVRELVGAMGGTVTCDESLAPGASFTVHLPRAPGAHAAPRA